jgi:hypothetical protein
MAATPSRAKWCALNPVPISSSNDGYRVSLHTDATTQMTGTIRPGDHIEAKVNAQSHALAIRQVK